MQRPVTRIVFWIHPIIPEDKLDLCVEMNIVLMLGFIIYSLGTNRKLYTELNIVLFLIHHIVSEEIKRFTQKVSHHIVLRMHHNTIEEIYAYVHE